jgi:hypothetical protein
MASDGVGFVRRFSSTAATLQRTAATGDRYCSIRESLRR